MPLADDELIALLRKEEEAASGFQDAALSAIREEALAYYDRQPYGDEQEGASSIVTSEFADVVESLMPGLMRVFTGSDDLAKFVPTAPGQEKWAKEASEYVPHVLMRQNDGFRIVSALLKDALMYRVSGVTVDLEDVEDKRSVPVRNLTQDAVDLIVAEAEAQGAELALALVPDPPDLAGAPQPALDGVAAGMSAPPSRTFSGVISRGYFAAARGGAAVTDANAYKNGVMLARRIDPTSLGALLPIHSVHIGAFNNAGIASSLRASGVGLACIGASLSGAQELAQYTAVQAFATAVGAQV